MLVTWAPSLFAAIGIASDELAKSWRLRNPAAPPRLCPIGRPMIPVIKSMRAISRQRKCSSRGRPGPFIGIGETVATSRKAGFRSCEAHIWEA